MSLIAKIEQLKIGYERGTGWKPNHIQLSDDVYKALEAEVEPMLKFFSASKSYPPQVNGLLIDLVPGMNIMEVYRK